LPKGGGAIRCIGEKFAEIHVTGTGSMAVPIYTGPRRSGFGPRQTLSYDSGLGNGPLGFGWSISTSASNRKADKRLSQYLNFEKSDVFFHSRARNLGSVAPGREIFAVSKGYVNI
jgi:hypothetical protein